MWLTTADTRRRRQSDRRDQVTRWTALDVAPSPTDQKVRAARSLGWVACWHDGCMGDDAEGPESTATFAEVDAWFNERGYRVVPSATDYSDQVRASPWGKRAPSRDHHAWVALTKLDGTVVSPGYGSGTTLAEAAVSAQRRWRTEQEGGPQPGPRFLP